MTPLDCARAIGRPISQIGGRFMTDRQTFARAGEVGYEPNFALYAAGRFGVFSRAHHDVVVSAAVFISPDVLVPAWDEALTKGDPVTVSAWYAEVCAQYGRDHLDPGDHLAELAELAEVVVDSAPTAGAPLFAGWRALPRPEDPPGRAALLLHLMRELRFARHAVAVLATGLDPVEAIVGGSGGTANAELFGWHPPYPQVDPGKRDAAEALTDEMAARDLAVLDDGQRERLAAVVAQVRGSMR